MTMLNITQKSNYSQYRCGFMLLLCKARATTFAKYLGDLAKDSYQPPQCCHSEVT